MFKGLIGDQPKFPDAICPHCNRIVKKPHYHRIGFKEKMYSCPHCHKVLGFSKYDS